MWRWIETHMKEFGSTMLKPGDENHVDENQDKIMNIYFALNDFGRMHMLLELQELYK